MEVVLIWNHFPAKSRQSPLKKTLLGSQSPSLGPTSNPIVRSYEVFGIPSVLDPDLDPNVNLPLALGEVYLTTRMMFAI